MVKIPLKPLSVNEAWQGRRFKTKKYRQFESNCLFLLPNIKIPHAPLKVSYVFGFSNKFSDIGNPEKMITDILCKKYGFDDRDIYEMDIKKQIVSKGDEFFTFSINSCILNK